MPDMRRDTPYTLPLFQDEKEHFVFPEPSKPSPKPSRHGIYEPGVYDPHADEEEEEDDWESPGGTIEDSS